MVAEESLLESLRGAFTSYLPFVHPLISISEAELHLYHLPAPLLSSILVATLQSTLRIVAACAFAKALRHHSD